MDARIKKILKNPGNLFISLGHREFMNWMDDVLYLKIAYRIRMGKKLDLKNPRTFNEKLQWIKIHDRNPIYTELVDKYAVRKHIEEKIGEEYLIPLVGGPWNSFDEIDFDKLPDQFVLKCTHDSGGLVICRDKQELNIQVARKKIERSLKRNFYWHAREWPYKNVPHRIVAEKYMEDENSARGLTDYKFFCFNKKPELIYISQGLEDHATASISFFDLGGHKMPFWRTDFKPIEGDFILPANFEEMVKIAQKLAEQVESPFVRVDLYSIWGKVYFSEITFAPCSGMIPFEPEEWDGKLGDWIVLPGKE